VHVRDVCRRAPKPYLHGKGTAILNRGRGRAMGGWEVIASYPVELGEVECGKGRTFSRP
jgi:hypothetical protein